MGFTIQTPGDRPINRRTRDCMINAFAVAFDMPYQAVAASAFAILRKRKNWNGSIKGQEISKLIRHLNKKGMVLFTSNHIHDPTWIVQYENGASRVAVVPEKLRIDNPSILELPGDAMTFNVQPKKVKYITNIPTGYTPYEWARREWLLRSETIKNYRYIIVAGRGTNRHAICAEYDPERDEWFMVDQNQGLVRLHDQRTKGRAEVQEIIAVHK